MLTSAVCTSDSYCARCKIQTLHIDLRDIAGAQPILADAQEPVVVGEVFAGHIQDGFRLQRLNKGAAQIEEQISLEIRALRGSNFGAFLRAFETQFALVFPFVQIAGGNQRQKITQWPIGIGPDRIELIERCSCRWVGAEEAR